MRAVPAVLLAATLAAGGLASGCDTGRPAPSPSRSATGTPGPTRSPAASSGAASARARATPSTPAVEVPTDPDLLAGARVLCSWDGAALPATVETALSHGHAAGVILFGPNITTQAHTRALAAQVQAAAAAATPGLPAIVATDQEGGQVRRIPGPPTASAAVMGGQPASSVRAQGAATAANLLAWGVDVNLAPVADVARPGSFEVGQARSFGTAAAPAATAVAAFVAGLHDRGVAATVKHYPGLGAASASTDTAPVTIGLPAATLAAVDQVPFAAGIAAGADLVMMSSASYPALAAGPALASPAVVTGRLRGTLGFTGVVVSDALDGKALAAGGTVGQTAVRAAQAGVDLFLGSGPAVCGQAQAALAAAIRSGTITADAAAASYRRLAALRGRLRSS